MIWERSGDTYYAAVAGLDGEEIARLIVEPYGDLWDWVVWRPDEDHDKARQGIVGTVQDAVREAERAADMACSDGLPPLPVTNCSFTQNARTFRE